MTIGIALILLGLLGYLLGRRGFEVGNHPHCAACGFNLHGLPLERQRCPECGADILRDAAIRIGHRRSIRAAIFASVAVASLGAVFVAAAALDWWAAWDGSPYKPAAWLIAEIDSPNESSRARACAQLCQRIEAGSLTYPETQRLATKILALQADRALTWDMRFGDLLQAAHNRPPASRISDALWERYLAQAMEFSLRIRPRIQMDDPIPIALSCRLRAGTDYTNMGMVTFIPEATLQLGPFTGNLRGQSLTLDQIPTPLEWSLLWLPDANGPRPTPAKSTAGAASLNLKLTMTARDGSGVTARQTDSLALPFQLLAHDESSVRLASPLTPAMRQEMANALRWRGTTDSQGNLILDRDGLRLWIFGPPTSAAFWVVLRQDGREWSLTRAMVRPNDAASISLALSSALIDRGLHEGLAEIVCLPDPALAIATVDVLEVWGEPIYRTVMVKTR